MTKISLQNLSNQGGRKEHCYYFETTLSLENAFMETPFCASKGLPPSNSRWEKRTQPIDALIHNIARISFTEGHLAAYIMLVSTTLLAAALIDTALLKE